MTAHAPGTPSATRVDYQMVIHRLSQRLAAAEAEAVMTQVALEMEREAHTATRQQLEAATTGDAAEGDDTPTAPRARSRRSAGAVGTAEDESSQ